MLCEKCGKNEATCFYHENINGRTRAFRLCAGCAEKMEGEGELPKLSADRLFEDFDPFGDDSFFGNPFKSMNSLLSGFFGSDRALTSGGGKKTGGEEKKCEGCGTTLREFAARGAGCPRCLETFAEELAPTVSRTHGRAAHVGRAPSRFRGRIERKRRIEALGEEMREAVKNEDFERAAEIRDELKKLRMEDVPVRADAEAPAEDPAGKPAEAPAEKLGDDPAGENPAGEDPAGEAPAGECGEGAESGENGNE